MQHEFFEVYVKIPLSLVNNEIDMYHSELGGEIIDNETFQERSYYFPCSSIDEMLYTIDILSENKFSIVRYRVQSEYNSRI